MLLQLQNVSGGYGKGDIVKNVSCEADEGDILCLAGPNGCGKTTLFRLIMGSIPLSGGRILIDGQDHLKLSPRELANRIAYIPQYHSPVFSYTVLDVVLMGRASHFSAFDSPRLSIVMQPLRLFIRSMPWSLPIKNTPPSAEDSASWR